MDRQGRPPKPEQVRHRGDHQMLVETIACRLLAGPTDQLRVTAADRWLLYDFFPRGFGLMIYEDPDTMDLVVTLTDDANIPVLADIMAGMRGDRLRGDRIPDYLKGKRTGG